MKLFKRLFMLIVCIAVALTLFACGGNEECKNHADTNGDGLCEECGKAAESTQTANELALIEDGEALFSIVYSSDVSVEVRLAINNLVRDLGKLGITVKANEEDASTEQECEVLVGDITSRDDKFIIDAHTYGMEGYAIKIIEKKLVIVGGSAETLMEAFEIFTEDILKIDDLEEDASVAVKTDDQKEVIQEDYDISSITIGDNDLRGYVILTDTSSYDYLTQATELQSNIYKNAGIWLPIHSLSESAYDKAVIIRHAEKDDTGEDSFRIYVENNNLICECEYDNSLGANFSYFVAQTFTKGEGDIKLSGKVYTKDVSVVTYRDFGAKGDGKTNDFAAMKAAHDFANISGQTVKANPKDTYYISDTRILNPENNKLEVKQIVIMTNTDWQGAKIIIDDTDIAADDGSNMHSSHVFLIKAPDESKEILSGAAVAHLKNLGPDTEKLEGLNLKAGAMLIIYHPSARIYRRYGENANANGSAQNDIIVVDKDGNIDPETKIFFNYDTVSKIEVYYQDHEDITIQNANVETKATRKNVFRGPDPTTGENVFVGSYFDRGIRIERSGATLLNIHHRVTGEFSVSEQNDNLLGPPYHGFFTVYYSNNITIKDCSLPGRRYYKKADIGYGGTGTYGFNAYYSANIQLLNVIQTNFYKDDINKDDLIVDGSIISTEAGEYWGIGAVNHCKNLVYEDCILSRYDAHAGLVGGRLTRSKVCMINLMGGGDFIIEDTTVVDTALFSMRTDYGASHKGTIYLDNVTIDTSASVFYLNDLLWTNYDFGQKNCFPNIVINNLHFKNGKIPVYIVNPSVKISDTYKDSRATVTANIHLPEVIINGSSVKNNNIYTPPEYFKVTGNDDGIIFYVPDVPFFEETELEGIERIALQ